MCVGDKWNHANNIKEINIDSTLHESIFVKVLGQVQRFINFISYLDNWQVNHL